MTEHTPTPWEIHEHKHIDGEYWASIGHKGRGPIIDIVGAEGARAEFYQIVAGMRHLVTPVEEQRANAAFIVRAVNSHEQLVEMVELLEKSLVYQIDKAVYEGDDEGARLKTLVLVQARAALAAAKGE